MSLRLRLIKSFANFAYRHSYLDSFVDASIATQIQVLRESKKWTQTELAEAAKMKQPQVSRLEDVDNSSWQIRTLKRIAKAFDVALVVRFESFGSVLRDIDDFGRIALQRPSFSEDPVFSDMSENYGFQLKQAKMNILSKGKTKDQAFGLGANVDAA